MCSSDLPPLRAHPIYITWCEILRSAQNDNLYPRRGELCSPAKSAQIRRNNTEVYPPHSTYNIRNTKPPPQIRWGLKNYIAFALYAFGILVCPVGRCTARRTISTRRTAKFRFALGGVAVILGVCVTVRGRSPDALGFGRPSGGKIHTFVTQRIQDRKSVV